MKVILTLFVVLMGVAPVQAQIARQRASTKPKPLVLFETQNIGAQSTVDVLPRQNLNMTIMHTFGIVTEKPLNNFFGFDFGPNVRLGFDYGITDSWTVGIGRSSREKGVDFRTKFAVLKQTDTGSIPLSITLKGDLGITTVENGLDVIDKMSFLSSAIFARQFNEHLVVQLSPMYAHFNTVFDEGDPNDYLALGVAAQYRFNMRYAVFFESYPALTEMAPGSKNAFTVGLDLGTGGHVFQLFLTSSPLHTEQYVLYQTTDDFWAGDFRFGFNVNRLFGLKH